MVPVRRLPLITMARRASPHRRPLIGVSAKAFLFRPDGKFLILRRTKTAPSHPLCWDIPGGEVDFGEEPLDSVRREIREEAGIAAKDLRLFDARSSVHGKEFWAHLAYIGETSGRNLQISWEHDLHRWVSPREFLRLKASKKLKEFARALMRMET